MADIILDRQTYILISDTLDGINVGLFPRDDLYPSDDPEYVHYPTETATMAEHIVEGSMTLDEMIAEGDIDLGKLYSTKFECDLFDIDTDLQGKFIQVYQMSDEYSETIPMFLGYIDSCTSDRLGTDYHIIAYDLAYYYGGIDISSIWNRYMSTNTPISTTYGDFPDIQIGSGATPSYIKIDWYKFLKLVFDEIGIVYDFDFNLKLDVSGYYGLGIDPMRVVRLYVNSNVKKMLLSDLIASICQLAKVMPHFGKDGVFRTISLSTSSSAIENATDLTDNYEKENLDVSQLVRPPFNNISYKYNTYSGNNTTVATFTETVNSNENKYEISNNILLLLTGCIKGSTTYRVPSGHSSGSFNNTSLITNICTYLQSIYYYVGSISLIVSDVTDLIGNVVKVQVSDEETIYFPVLKSSYSGTQFINQTVSAEGTILTAEDVAPIDYSGENTQTQVDTLTAEVTDLTTKTENLGVLSWLNVAENESVANNTDVKMGDFTLEKGAYVVDVVGAFSHTGTTDGSGYRLMYVAKDPNTSAMGYIQIDRRAPISTSGQETMVRISFTVTNTESTTYSVYMKQVNGQSVTLTGNVRVQTLRIR